MKGNGKKVKEKKDAFMPALRVTADMAERTHKACEKLKIDPAWFRRCLIEDFIRIAESGEKPAMPPRIMTFNEEVLLNRYLEIIMCPWPKKA